MRAALAVAVMVCVGCTGSDSVVCGDVVCPSTASCGPNNECIPEGCGDNVIAGDEACDGSAATMRCTDLGYYGIQQVGCTPVCTVDVTGCNGTCGDDRINGPETCDGIPPEGLACADFGYDVGGLGCSSACTLALDACGVLGWRDAPGGATNELRAIWTDGRGGGFAVGLGGTILRSTEGVWVPMSSGTTADLFGVFGLRDGSDANNPVDVVIAVGANGTILRFGAAGWEPMASPTTQTLFGISAASITRAYIVGAAGTILRISPSGWIAAASGTTNDLYSVAVADTVAFAVGQAGTVLREVNGNWNPAPGAPVTAKALRAVHGAGTEVWAVGADATVFRLRDTTWSVIDVTLGIADRASFDVQGVYVTLRGNVVEAFLGMELGVILHWDGSQLVEHTSPTTRSLYGLHGAGPSRVLAVTKGGRVIEYNGTDRTTAPHSIAPTVPIFGLFRALGVTIISGASGFIARADDGVWAGPQQIANGATLNAVWGGGGDVYVGAAADPSASQVTQDGQIGVWKSNSVGVFSRVSSFGGVNDLYGVAGASPVIHAVGETIQKLEAGTWSLDRPATANDVLYGVTVTPDGVWFAVGYERVAGFSDHALILRKQPGGTWQRMEAPFGTTLSDVWGTSGSDVFAVGAIGLVVHFDGTAWRQLYTGTAENFASVRGTSPHDVYAGGPNRTLYHYDGVAWTPMKGSDFDITRVWPTAGDVLIVGAGMTDRITRPLVPTEERCQDPWDNDGDDGINCEDPDCANSLYCIRGGTCETLERIECGMTDIAFSTYTGVARIDDLPCIDHSTPGPEASLRFVAELSGPVTVTIADPTNTLDVVVVDAERGACQLDTCRGATAGGDGTQTVTFDATAGEIYFVLVDGPVYTAEAFTVSVACP